MKKALAIVAHHPELKVLMDRYDQEWKPIEDKQKFIAKQTDDLKKESKVLRDANWGRVQGWLSGRGLLPEDYSDDKYGLHYDEDTGVVSLFDREEKNRVPEGLKDFLSKIAGIVKIDISTE